MKTKLSGQFAPCALCDLSTYTRIFTMKSRAIEDLLCFLFFFNRKNPFFPNTQVGEKKTDILQIRNDKINLGKLIK